MGLLLILEDGLSREPDLPSRSRISFMSRGSYFIPEARRRRSTWRPLSEQSFVISAKRALERTETLFVCLDTWQPNIIGRVLIQTRNWIIGRRVIHAHVNLEPLLIPRNGNARMITLRSLDTYYTYDGYT